MKELKSDSYSRIASFGEQGTGLEEARHRCEHEIEIKCLIKRLVTVTVRENNTTAKVTNERLGWDETHLKAPAGLLFSSV